MNIEFKKNAFDILRIVCAIQVMYGHFVEHFALDSINPMFGKVLRITQFIPGRGVVVFFAISGYLSICSIEKSSNYKEYFGKKVKRIYPELLVAFVINTIIIKLFYGFRCNYKEFLIYLFTQTTFFQFYTGEWLRQYGAGTANGSLWTISVIVQFYLLIYVMFILLKDKSKEIWIGLYLFFVSFSIFLSNMQCIVPNSIFKILSVSVFPYMHIFLAGVLCYLYRNNVLIWLKKNCILILPIYVLVRFLVIQSVQATNINLGVNYDVFSSLLLSIGVIGIAYYIGEVNIKHEISYSIFIYHMIFVNVGMEIIKKSNMTDGGVLTIACFCAVITTAVSLVSNLVINKNLKKNRGKL